MNLKHENNYLFFLTLLYFAVSFIGIIHHELWLDEAHHWLLSRDSETFLDLIKNTRYEGHPILWNILLYGITRITLNPFWMQFLHILISTSVVFLFLKKAPFSLVFKTLFIFGYFMLFEYNLISRNYILGVFFLFLACSIFEDRNKKSTLLMIYLALAANIHLMFSVIAFALFLIVLLENYLNKELSKKVYYTGYFVFGLGLVLLFVQLYASNSGWFFSTIENIPLSEKLTKGVIALFKGIVAVPDFSTIHFWNTNFIVNANRRLASVLGLLIYFVPLILFFKNKKTLFFVYVALIGTQIFFFITQRSATRFHGMTYIIIIIALWIEQYYTKDSNKFTAFFDRFKVVLLQKPLIYGMLIIHFICGITAYTFDYLYPFSTAKESVDFIKEKKLNNLPVISLTCDGTSISPYLEKKVWFLCDGSYQSYCHWDLSCAINSNPVELQKMISVFMIDHNRALYVSYFSPYKNPKPNVWTTLNPKVKIRFLKRFDQCIVPKTEYYIFEVSKNYTLKQ